MSNRVVDLAVRISADIAGDVVDKVESVGGAASRMADDVESSTGRAGAGLERMGGASEGLDDKFGRAAGAAGALASGADLIGNEKASVALQAMALATDFFSGVGQAGILVTEGLSAAQGENIVVSKAAAVATKAQAVAQGALNAVMSANPILLVVVAVAALVAGFVLAYKHSETFRSIVQKAMGVAKTAVHGVVDEVGDIVDWLGKVVSKFGFVGAAVHGYVFVIKTEIGLVVDIVQGVATVVDDVGDKFSGFKTKAVDAARTVAHKAGGFFDKFAAPIQTVKDLIDDVIGKVNDLIDLIGHIHVPHIDLPGPLGRTATPGRVPVAGGPTVTVTVDMPVTINLPTATDPTVAAQAIVTALVGLANRLGITVTQLLEQNAVAA